ncbi:MAG: SdiA-regulated domain-containing protein [Ignavibacteriales bacterium]|nr:SdiA-regulated domain-containing protein [Ignavibacteriales bacterium]
MSKQDLEGITSIGDSILAVVVEITREILFLNLKNNSESVYQTGFEGEVNNGFEGITYFPTEENLFIANEKNPKLIFKTNINAEILSYSSIDFTEDLAGLYFDQSNNTLWTLSQEGNMIYKCSPEYKIIEQYSIPNIQYEGIAVNGKNIYLVSDSEKILSIYLIP